MATIQELRDRAAADMARWPQYKGHFDGYQLCTVKKGIKTKLGKAFIQEETTIFDPNYICPDMPDCRVVYSFSNKCDTMVHCRNIQEVK